MPALVTIEFFVGEINIPGSGDNEVADRLNYFIARYEEKLLRALLGHTMYEAFYEALAAEVAPPPAVRVPLEQKWKDLRDGKTFTDLSGIERRWIGIRNNAAAYKQSPVANFVYYWWLRDKVSHTSKAGEINQVTDDSEKVSPADKQSRAWNEMVTQNRDLFYFLDANQSTYSDWDRNGLVTREFQYLSPINAFNI